MSKKNHHYQSFTKNLMHWHLMENKRDMPWKNQADPYKIWLSEIILQQTRVNQGLNYYNSFISNYPTIKKLANAPDKEVFKLWEGLGYYSRCRNLLHTARFIVEQLQGKFPNSYPELIKLKGVGPYTAAAIASFAFGEAVPAVDGNFYRVLSRYFGIDTPIDSNEGKKEFYALAEKLILHATPAEFNQAMMDFGATVCKPKGPNCAHCPLQKNCVAFQQNLINDLPVKSKSIAKKDRWIHYLVLKYRDCFYVRMRNAKDIWHHLHEFYPIETNNRAKVNELPEFTRLTRGAKHISTSQEYVQALTHRRVHIIFHQFLVNKKPNFPDGDWVGLEEMQQLAFPKTHAQYIGEVLVLGLQGN